MPLFISCPLNDPRISTKWGIGMHKPTGVNEAYVAFVLFDRQDETKVRTINLGTPEGAREIALQLLSMANLVERQTFEAVQTGKEGC